MSLLRLELLAEDLIAFLLLAFQFFDGFFQIFDGRSLLGRLVSNDKLGFRVYLKDRFAAGAPNFEQFRCHSLIIAQGYEELVRGSPGQRRPPPTGW